MLLLKILLCCLYASAHHSLNQITNASDLPPAGETTDLNVYRKWGKHNCVAGHENWNKVFHRTGVRSTADGHYYTFEWAERTSSIDNRYPLNDCHESEIKENDRLVNLRNIEENAASVANNKKGIVANSKAVGLNSKRLVISEVTLSSHEIRITQNERDISFSLSMGELRISESKLLLLLHQRF